MKFLDSHVHLDRALSMPGGPEAMVERARAAGVERLVAVGGDSSADAAALDAARQWPGVVAVTVGRDREHAGADAGRAAVTDVEHTVTAAVAAGIAVAGIGEIGLDYHYHAETAGTQVDLFRAQLALAARRHLPVVVHCREAETDVCRCLREHAMHAGLPPGCIGVVHSFTGTEDTARDLLETGYCLGFSGIVTFRNADRLRAVAAGVPDDRLLVETDTPFLAPVPRRGQPNEPAFVVHVAECLARVRGCDVERVARLTWDNACRLFGLPAST